MKVRRKKGRGIRKRGGRKGSKKGRRKREGRREKEEEGRKTGRNMRRERRKGGGREEREEGEEQGRRREGKREVATERTVFFPSAQFSPQFSALCLTSSMAGHLTLLQGSPGAPFLIHSPSQT